MAELTRLRAQRGQVKAKITRQKVYFDSLNLTGTITELLVTELSTRLQRIEPFLDEFNVIQSEIEFLSENVENNERDEFEKSYYMLVACIKNVISPRSVSSLQIQGSVQNTSATECIKLPTIKLPSFSGRYEEWLEFRDSFTALIHENSTISDVQKFYYLRSSLQGDACKIIESLQVSEANYDIAWQMLKERFENKRLIIHNHVKAIFDLQIIRKESHIELRKLFDDTTKNLRALNVLGEPTCKWDTLIIHIVINKLDCITRREWELFEIAGELPTMQDLNKFLKQRCELLEKLEYNVQVDIRNQSKFPFKPKQKGQINSYVSEGKFSCYFCKKPHTIYNCEQFLKCVPSVRVSEIRKLHLCANCLRPNHTVKECLASGCRKCGRKHNTLLHLEPSAGETSATDVQANNSQNSEDNTQVSVVGHSGHVYKGDNSFKPSQVLLSTATVYVRDARGNLQRCRALLDSGSQSNFVTEELCKKLNLKLQQVNFSITGVGQSRANANYSTQLQLISNNKSYKMTAFCLVLPRITEKIPSISFNKTILNIPENLQLADPTFNNTGPIDILLGSSVFWELLCVGQLQIGSTHITLQKTRLGWIVAGNMNIPGTVNVTGCFSTDLNNTFNDDQLLKFWQVEEVNSKQNLSENEQYCESHFLNTFKRSEQGRFIVTMPLKDNFAQLGNSRDLALNRFYNQERKLLKDPKLYEEYKGFMREYLQLGHMKVIKEHNDNTLTYYLPHHPIVKESSTTTRVRVVFDASMKSDTGLSLNDIQHIGYTVQDDLFSIILRFRKYKYVMSSDISKMYRMIIIEPKQQHLQRIFWRFDPSSKIQCFELCTVTYGTASAPYLATRCLYQLAIENEYIYPLASQTIKHDFYVDDCITGSDSESELLQIQHEVSKILSSAGFELRKWLTNKPELCNKFHINSELQESLVQIGENEASKTLGIFWNASKDTIQYTISNINNQIVNKRSILSTISQIFDPLGLLAPIVIVAKMLMQKLWLAKLGWDEAIPQNLFTIWRQFCSDLHHINDFRIPRHVITSEYKTIELHAFCDASERAYGACVYIRCCNKLGQYSSTLLAAKSRVAPIKQLTLPRLELCGAVLLAQLVEKCLESIKINFDKQYFWSDSTITLAWIKASPTQWKTFVANRVGEIQRLTSAQDWYHVDSRHNPADLISRGMKASDISNSSLWWSGPSWLTTDNLPINQGSNSNIEIIPEQRTSTCLTISDDFNIFNKFSTMRKLQRVVAYCNRFMFNAKTCKKLRIKGPLTTNELSKSMDLLVRLAQQQSFTLEYDNLIKNKSLSKKSHLLTLNPFFDENKLIRVGGRIQNSYSKFDKKHPIILPTKHVITKLILEQEHIRLLHCGPTMLLSSIRQRFWPVSGRKICKSIVRQCITCFKVNPRTNEYLMGNLPVYRVNQSFPFQNTGLDYAGPFQVKDRKTRGAKLTKAYVCLFVCLATKAIHLELVSDLTTECFLAALNRFIGRRGRPTNIFSDNGRTYVGASTKLDEMFSFLNNNSDNIIENATSESISWHFIPARAPNFGGIWEAGVKSVKHHLKRVLGNAHLDFEGLATVLVRIESVLNSRPLCPISSDPEELNPLTPAHFLLGKSLTALPEENVLEIPECRLKYYQRLQKLVQHFWSKWHKDYLSELQSRTKWKTRGENFIKVGTVVLVKEDNAPPLKWHIGQVTQLHPGQDGVLRVVSVRINNNEVKRPVSKLCVFPFEKKRGC